MQIIASSFLRHLQRPLLLMLLCMTIGCQDDLNEQSSIEGGVEDNVNAQLMQLMHNVALNDGSHDDIIDRASCLELVLPVTVTINNADIIVNHTGDFETIAALFEQQGNADDYTIDFPVTVITSTHDQVVVASQIALNELVEACGQTTQNDADIECVDFVYPFGFSTFDPEFTIANVVSVQSDRELLSFVNTVQGSNLVTAINFPIVMRAHDDTTQEMSSHSTLSSALVEASSSCEEDDTYHFEEDVCLESEVNDFLMSCYWQITSYNNEDTLSNYVFSFGTNNYLLYFDTNIIAEATWSTSAIASGVRLSFLDLPVLHTNIGGNWTVTQCDEETLLLEKGDDIMTLERNCFQEPLDCFVSAVLNVCDNGQEGEATFDLTETLLDCDTSEVNIAYYYTREDASNQTNAISNPTNYTTTTSPEQLWVRATLLSDTSEFKIFFINLTVVDCCSNPQDYLNDLVIYMPLSEYPVELISGYVNSAAINECVVDRDGSDHCAISFNQDSFTIPVTRENSIVQGDQYTISVWFKMQNTNSGDVEIIFQKGTDASQEGFALGVTNFNTPTFFTSDFQIVDEDWSNEADVEWMNTDWHHLAITVDGANTVKLYRDGILRNEVINAALDIGSTALNEYTLGQNFLGHVDDLRVYKNALNATEIQQLFALGGDCYTCL
ncbi:LamG domain-containing protein [Dokdonia sp. PRO95]|uniref:LamG domain-containing protein n=1 Tax=Dokdonia sp. PRO95 TaxID=1239415 RepID=UPI0009DCE727|nr:LamG domain-containing protein [Dokdonia sp. PRO95]